MKCQRIILVKKEASKRLKLLTPILIFLFCLIDQNIVVYCVVEQKQGHIL